MLQQEGQQVLWRGVCPEEVQVLQGAEGGRQGESVCQDEERQGGMQLQVQG